MSENLREQDFMRELPHLIKPEVRLIPETKNNKTKILCTDSFRCKNMKCKTCRFIKRNYFINNGIWFSKKHELNCHLIITWKVTDDSCNWSVLIRNIALLSRKITDKSGKFIRTVAIGNKSQAPHVHFLVNKRKAEFILRKALAHKISDLSSVKKDCDYQEELLGYMFDENYIPTFLNPERPRGMRILSASRGMRCGFPPFVKRH